MAHGGARPNAGRKVGATNKATQEAVQAAKLSGELPLDFLLRKMRDPNIAEDKQIDCAKAAAPYLHAKRATVELTGDADNPVEVYTRIELVDGDGTD